MEDSFQKNLDEVTPRTTLRQDLKVLEPEFTPVALVSQHKDNLSVGKRTLRSNAKIQTRSHSSKRLLEVLPEGRAEKKRLHVVADPSSEPNSSMRNIRGVDQTFANISLGDDSSVNESIDYQAPAKFRKLRNKRKRALLQPGLMSGNQVTKTEKNNIPVQDSSETYENISFSDESSLDGSRLALRRKLQPRWKSNLSLPSTDKTYGDISKITVDTSSDSISLDHAKTSSLKHRSRGSAMPRIDVVLPQVKAEKNPKQKNLASSDIEEKTPLIGSEEKNNNQHSSVEEALVNQSSSYLEDTINSDMEDSNTNLDNIQTTKRQQLSQRAPAIQLNVSSILKNIKMKPIPEAIAEEAAEDFLDEMISKPDSERTMGKRDESQNSSTLSPKNSTTHVPPPLNFRDANEIEQNSSVSGPLHVLFNTSSDFSDSTVKSNISAALESLDEDHIVSGSASAGESQTGTTTSKDSESKVILQSIADMDISAQRLSFHGDTAHSLLDDGDFFSRRLSQKKDLESHEKISSLVMTRPGKSFSLNPKENFEHKGSLTSVDIYTSTDTEINSEKILDISGNAPPSPSEIIVPHSEASHYVTPLSSAEGAKTIETSSYTIITEMTTTPTPLEGDTSPSMNDKAIASPPNRRSSIVDDHTKTPTPSKSSIRESSRNQATTSQRKVSTSESIASSPNLRSSATAYEKTSPSKLSSRENSINQRRTPSQKKVNAMEEMVNLERSLSTSKMKRSIDSKVRTSPRRPKTAANQEWTPSPSKQSARKSTEEGMLDQQNNLTKKLISLVTPLSLKRKTSPQSTQISRSASSNLRKIVLSSSEVQIHPEEAIKAQRVYYKLQIEDEIDKRSISGENALDVESSSPLQEMEASIDHVHEKSASLSKEPTHGSEENPDMFQSSIIDHAAESPVLEKTNMKMTPNMIQLSHKMQIEDEIDNGSSSGEEALENDVYDDDDDETSNQGNVSSLPLNTDTLKTIDAVGPTKKAVLVEGNVSDAPENTLTAKFVDNTEHESDESSGNEEMLNLIPITIRKITQSIGEMASNTSEHDSVNDEEFEDLAVNVEVTGKDNEAQQTQLALQTPKTKQLTMREFLQRLSTKPVKPTDSNELIPEIKERLNKVSSVISKLPQKLKVKAVVQGHAKKKELPLTLPANLTKEIFTHYAKCKVSREAVNYVVEASERFWKNTAVDLLNISKGRESTVTRGDVEQLMTRQGFIKDSQDLKRLIEEYLPAEEWNVLLPTAYAKNKVYPPNTH